MTKQERNMIYEAALKYAKEDSPPFGLCMWISWAYRDFYMQWEPDMNLFPEIMRHKVDNLELEPYWFDTEDRDVRIKILEQAIKETK